MVTILLSLISHNKNFNGAFDYKVYNCKIGFYKRLCVSIESATDRAYSLLFASDSYFVLKSHFCSSSKIFKSSL